MKFKHLVAFSPTLLFFSFCQAQSVVNTTGSTIQSNDFVVEYSIGEIGITTLEDPTPAKAYFVTQGLLQPKLKLQNPDCPTIKDSIYFFPNPTRNILAVVPSYDWITSYYIYAADGKLVRQGPFVNNQIHIADLAAAVYFIKFFPGCNGKFRVIKVIKQ